MPAAAARTGRRLVPGTWRGRILLLVALVLIVGLVFGARYYFGELPDERADEYRADSLPELRKAASAMDDVYESFDTYLAENTLRRSEVRSADDLDELRRRVLPVIEDAQDALQAAERRTQAARKRVRRAREAVAAVPDGPPMLGDAESIREARAAAKAARVYLKDSERYLDDYAKFVSYALGTIALERDNWQSAEELSPDAGFEEAKAYFSEGLTEAQRTRSEYLDIDPPPDADRLHELSTASATATVDFYEDAVEAFSTLNQALFDDARADLLAELKRFDDEVTLAYWRFSVDSRIQRASRTLSSRADELERRYARLGTGTTDVSEPHNRPPLPVKPDVGGGGGANGGDTAPA